MSAGSHEKDMAMTRAEDYGSHRDQTDLPEAWLVVVLNAEEVIHLSMYPSSIHALCTQSRLKVSGEHVS